MTLTFIKMLIKSERKIRNKIKNKNAKEDLEDNITMKATNNEIIEKLKKIGIRE